MKKVFDVAQTNGKRPPAPTANRDPKALITTMPVSYTHLDVYKRQPYTGEWNIEGKSYDRSNVKAYSTYGTGRINAYKIIEETLNLDVYKRQDRGCSLCSRNFPDSAVAATAVFV